MIEFLIQNASTLIVGGVVVSLLVLAIAKMARDRKRGRTACGSCGGGCGGCAMAGTCGSAKRTA